MKKGQPMNYLNRGDIPNYGFSTDWGGTANPYGQTGMGMGWDMPSYYNTGEVGNPAAWDPTMSGQGAYGTGVTPYDPSLYGANSFQTGYTPSYGTYGTGDTNLTPGSPFFQGGSSGGYTGFGGDYTTLPGASQGFGSLYEHARGNLAGSDYFGEGSVSPYSSHQSYLETGAPGYAQETTAFTGAPAHTGTDPTDASAPMPNYGDYRATAGYTGGSTPHLFEPQANEDTGVEPWSDYFSKEDIGSELKTGQSSGYGQSWSDLIYENIEGGLTGDEGERAMTYASLPAAFGTSSMGFDDYIDPSKLHGQNKVDLSTQGGTDSLLSPFYSDIPSGDMGGQLKGWLGKTFHDSPDIVNLDDYMSGYETGEGKSIKTLLQAQKEGSIGPEQKRATLAQDLEGYAGDLQTDMFGTGTGLIPQELVARREIQEAEAGDIAEFDLAREEMIGDASAGTGFLGEREERWQDYIDDYNKEVKRGQKDIKGSKADLSEAQEDIEAELANLRAETTPSRRQIRGFEGGGLRSGRRSRVGEEERKKLSLQRMELERQRQKAIDVSRREQGDTREEFSRDVEDLGLLRDEETEAEEAALIAEGPILSESKLGEIQGRREEMTGPSGPASVPQALETLEQMFTKTGGIESDLKNTKAYYDPASTDVSDYRGELQQELTSGAPGGMLDTIVGDSSTGAGRAGFMGEVESQIGPDGQWDPNVELAPDWFGNENKGIGVPWLKNSKGMKVFGQNYEPAIQYGTGLSTKWDNYWQDEGRAGYANRNVPGSREQWWGKKDVTPWYGWKWDWNHGLHNTMKFKKNPEFKWHKPGWGSLSSDSKGYSVIPNAGFSGRNDDRIEIRSAFD